MDAQFLISAITVIGAGVSTYVGVRVALAEVRKDIAYLQKDVERLYREMDRWDDKSQSSHRRD
jgi:hypothetical protein